MVQDWEDAPANYGNLEVGELNEAIRVLEEVDYQANAEEELREQAVDTRARVDPERFQAEHEADRCAEYMAMLDLYRYSRLLDRSLGHLSCLTCCAPPKS